MKKKLFYILILIFFSSCKKEEKVYFDNGNLKYIKILEKDILYFKRFDSKENLAFSGKFKDNQLIDTLFIFDNEFDYIVKIDSSDNSYFYGTFISKYSTGKNSKISRLRYNKGTEIDNVLASSLLFGKEINYKPNGEMARERYYKIKGNTSEMVDEKIYDENLK